MWAIMGIVKSLEDAGFMVELLLKKLEKKQKIKAMDILVY